MLSSVDGEHMVGDIVVVVAGPTVVGIEEHGDYLSP